MTEGTVLVDRYAIEGRLGDGGMGIVYRARHVKLGRPFAIKVLHASLTDNPKILTRFAREAELAGRLRHDHVVSVVDVGVTDDGHHFMAMELAPGEDLATMLADGPLSEPRMLDIAKQLCSGLSHAHDHGLIHRDFKPHNVIVEQVAGGREIARIVDWGVAILLEDAGDVDTDDRLTTRGIVLGTPHYMAPEQARGLAIDHRVDIFALGLICYEMLTGKLPFDGTGVEVAQANLSSPIPAMAERAPDVHVDPVLEAVVRRLLAKNRDDRPPSGDAARELFELYERDRAACAMMLGLELPDTQRQSVLAQAHDATGSRDSDTDGARRAPRHDAERDRETDQLGAYSGRRRVAIIAAAFAAAFAILLWLATRGNKAAAPRSPSDDSERIALATVDTLALNTAADKPDELHEIVPDEVVPSEHDLHRLAVATPPRKSRPSLVAPISAPARAAAPTAAELAELYAALGRELRALEDAKGMAATLDLWPRYRWIRINDWLATPERRSEAAQLLERLRADIRANE